MRAKKRSRKASSALTPRQKQVLDFIRRRIRQAKCSPSVREIAEFLNVRSPNGIVGHLSALEQKGYILRNFGSRRSIVLVSKRRCTKFSTILGTIENGRLTECSDAAEPEMNLFEFLIKPKGCFILKIGDESLKNENIHKGDFLFLSRQKEPKGSGRLLLKDDDESLHFADFAPDPSTGNLKMIPHEETGKIWLPKHIFGIFLMLVRASFLPGAIRNEPTEPNKCENG